uniref:Uncharacterized protein n=1 Tax=Oryza brachyantha TaxID=4533 RepID=J3N141_ORYBR
MGYGERSNDGFDQWESALTRLEEGFWAFGRGRQYDGEWDKYPDDKKQGNNALVAMTYLLQGVIEVKSSTSAQENKPPQEGQELVRCQQAGEELHTDPCIALRPYSIRELVRCQQAGKELHTDLCIALTRSMRELVRSNKQERSFTLTYALLLGRFRMPTFRDLRNCDGKYAIIVVTVLEHAHTGMLGYGITVWNGIALASWYHEQYHITGSESSSSSSSRLSQPPLLPQSSTLPSW